MFFTVQTSGQKTSEIAVQWKVVAEVPAIDGRAKALGLAGPVTGVLKDKLIIAGGANFPDGMPWVGGKKRYHDDIYILQANNNGKYKWIQPATPRLTKKLAYSGNVSLPEGIVCVGGETDTGYTRDVFMLQWDDAVNDLKRSELPSLPFALANAAVTNIGRTIYVAGGENTESALNKFMRLDLNKPDGGWEILPSLPVAMSHSVAVAQSNGVIDGIFIIGGRSKSHTSLSKLYNTVLFFNPATKNWSTVSKISDGEKATNFSAGTAVPTGDKSILLVGGDDGVIFHKIELFNLNIAAAVSEEEKESLQKQKEKLLLEHPGFSRKVLAYNTVENTWSRLPDLPVPGPVTTTAVCWDGKIVIPSGEVMPGRRTPAVLMGEIQINTGKAKNKKP